MNSSVNIVLASASPRRKELLAQLGYQFDIVVPNIDEVRQVNESAEQYVIRLSKEKALAAQAMIVKGAKHAPDSIVLGSDTIVVAGTRVLEKPQDFSDAKRMLGLLSGSRHQVMTSITVVRNEMFKTEIVVTDVWFKRLTDAEIEQYWLSGEPQDKAGSYAIQGLGGKFVTRIEGSYYTVVGLPLFETDLLLHEFL